MCLGIYYAIAFPVVNIIQKLKLTLRSIYPILNQMGKQITFMIIPHGGGKTITRRISYRVVTLILILFISLITVIFLFLFYMGDLYIKALRVDALERRNRELEKEHAKLALMEQKLAEMERMGEHLRTMLGIDKAPPPLSISELRNLEPQLGSKSSDLNFSDDNYPFTEDVASFLEEQKREERNIPSGLPLEGWISRKFSSDHPAVDIVAPLLTPIMATADGICTFSGWDDIWGNYVEISHSKDIKTMYAHNSRNRIEKGERVRKGDIIGFLGSTGRSTGPHLHYEVTVRGKKVDPLSFSIR